MAESVTLPRTRGGRAGDPESHTIDAPTSYPFPKSQQGLMTWSQAVTRLEQAATYWLATTRPDGRPHVTPIWGVWLDDAFYFQGAPSAHWAANIAVNPAIAIHSESGDDVVILEGEAVRVITDDGLGERLIAAWQTKYDPLPPEIVPQPATQGVFRLRPRAARAWSAGLQDGARWHFAAS
jgi:hypothetical protein